MKEAKLLDTMQLHTCESGEISFWDHEHPYGANSEPVLVVGVSLKKGDEPEWKVHIPYQNLGELIKKLQQIEASQR